MDNKEDYDDEDDLDNESERNQEEEDEDEEDLPPDRTRDGQFDYVNDEGIVVPKDTIY